MRKLYFRKLTPIFPLTLATLLLAYFHGSAQKKEPAPRVDKYVSAAKTLPPELMIRMGNGIAEPTGDQKKEEFEIEQDQVKMAITWLGNANPEQRIAGAQQLAAYPTHEAEKQLVKSLAIDRSSEVRTEAARSLGFFENLKTSTVRGLLTALEDPDENVRQTALDTLQNLHDLLENEDKTREANKILASLKTQSKSSRVPKEMRKEIKNYLRDLLQ